MEVVKNNALPATTEINGATKISHNSEIKLSQPGAVNAEKWYNNTPNTLSP